MYRKMHLTHPCGSTRGVSWDIWIGSLVSIGTLISIHNSNSNTINSNKIRLMIILLEEECWRAEARMLESVYGNYTHPLSATMAMTTRITMIP
jgi:hypothetical protein